MKKSLEWFMSIAVLCSVLAFSGIVNESRVPAQGMARTELPVSIQNNTGRTIRYKEVSIAPNVALFFGANITYAILLYYERTVETSFRNNIRLWSTCTKPEQIVRAPYTPRNYQEFLFNA